MNDQPGTREELRQLLVQAGLGTNQTRVFLDSPTALLSGLIPAEAITEPATAGRARRAVQRLIARLGDPVPEGVQVTAARIRRPGTYLVELGFSWPGATARRHMDMEPYLRASRAHESLLNDRETFVLLRVDDDGVSWPGRPSFSAALLFAESWPALDDSATEALPHRAE